MTKKPCKFSLTSYSAFERCSTDSIRTRGSDSCKSHRALQTIKNPLCSNVFFVLLVIGNRTSDLVGFNYSDDEKTKYSYLEIISNLGLLRDSGCPLSLDVYKDSFFMLYFKTTFEIDKFRDDSRTFQTPINPHSPATLYLRFKRPLQKVLRVTILYRVHRQFQLTSSREAFLSHTLDQ